MPPPRARRTSPGSGPRRQPYPCFPHACAFSPAGPVRQPFQQSGAPGYLLFLTEQAATPVIHAGIKSGNSSMQRGGDRGCQERAQRLRHSAERSGRIEPHAEHAAARRVDRPAPAQPDGIVYTTANRNWELHLANPRPIGSPDNVTRLHDGRQWSSGVRAVDLGAVVDVEDVDSVISLLDPVDDPVGAAPGSVTASQSAE